MTPFARRVRPGPDNAPTTPEIGSSTQHNNDAAPNTTRRGTTRRNTTQVMNNKYNSVLAGIVPLQVFHKAEHVRRIIAQSLHNYHSSQSNHSPRMGPRLVASSRPLCLLG